LPAAKPDLPLPATAPAALPMHAARPAACLPQRGEAEACVVLGAKNAELRARIGQLEQRVKGLQASLGAGRQGKASGHEAPGPDAHAARPAAHGAAVSAAQTPDAHTQAPRPPARPAGPAPISSIKPLLPHKAKAPAPDDGLPWGLIGGAVAALAALGGVAALLRARRKRARKPGIPAQRGVLPRLRERFFTRNGAPPDADPAAGAIAEPTLE
jgi:hypothetical protein